MNMMNNVIMIVNLRPSAQKNLMARLHFVTLVKSVLQLYKVTMLEVGNRLVPLPCVSRIVVTVKVPQLDMMRLL